MKTLKTSKKDKKWFTQSRGETFRKVFPSNISIGLDDAFQQSTRHRKDDLGEERRRIPGYSRLVQMNRKISRDAV